MKLNPDCIRDVMLAIEIVQNVDHDLNLYHTDLTHIAQAESLSKYPEEDIAYTILMLTDGGLLTAKPTYADGKIYSLYVSGLTFAGHQYLEKIRNADRWVKVKSIGDKIGDYSLSAIEKIAEGVTSAALDKFLKQQ